MASNNSTIFRQIKMLRMIPREPRTVTASELTDRLNDQGYYVTLRTVQRDLNKLSLEFPFTCNDSEKTEVKNWYFPKDTYLFDIPEMSPLTAFCFNLTETFLSSMIPEAISNQLGPHFKSARNYLAGLQGPSWAKWSDKVRVVPRYQQLVPAKILPEILDTVFEALWREKRFEANYLPRHKEKSKQYIVNPLGLVFRHEVIYLVCTLWEYDDVLQLALHRFESVNLLDEEIIVPKNFNLDRYISEDSFSYPINDQMINLKVLFAGEVASHLYETKFSEDQRLIEQEDETVLLEASVKDTQELRWWLFGFGDYLEVLKPEELRDEFKRQISNLEKRYCEDISSKGK